MLDTRWQDLRNISWFLTWAEYAGRLVLTCISPEQTTWTAPLWRQVAPGQDTLGQNWSLGSYPLHLNSSAQTWPSDSLKGTCPRTDPAMPHPSSAQMTWAMGSAKFPSDTGVHSSPECTSTRPKQGPSPSTRRTNPKGKQQQTSESSWSWLDKWKQYITGSDVKAFLFQEWSMERELDSYCHNYIFMNKFLKRNSEKPAGSIWNDWIQECVLWDWLEKTIPLSRSLEATELKTDDWNGWIQGIHILVLDTGWLSIYFYLY